MVSLAAVVNHSVSWAMLSQYSRAEDAPVPVSQYKVMLSSTWSKVRTCPRSPTWPVQAHSFSAIQAHSPMGESVSEQPVLARAVCTVCHAGMGITQKSLAHGVPVVAVPFGRDQPEVARRIQVAGAGVRLPARKLTPGRLRAAVRSAIELRPGAQRIAVAFAATGGPAVASDVLEQLITTRR